MFSGGRRWREELSRSGSSRPSPLNKEQCSCHGICVCVNSNNVYTERLSTVYVRVALTLFIVLRMRSIIIIGILPSAAAPRTCAYM